ncbi:MAG: histidine kinase [Runella slithyformis]|nr:MAG: histidine kinase [Runella slithyformis]TAF23796.1 MAG: histidine kinase [Runella slithyformis]
MSDYWKHKQKIAKSDVWIVAFCFVLATPFFYETFVFCYQKIGLIKIIFFVFFHYFNPLLLVYFLVYFLLPVSIKNKNVFYFTLILLVTLLVQAALSRTVYGLLGVKVAKINFDTITFEIQDTIMLAAPLSMILFVKQLIEIQSQLLRTEKEKKEAELKLLKQQIDPHFLFNNLNVLGVLIQQDKNSATEYLNRFANLYRYLIKYKDEDVVLLEEEWSFAQNYIFLIQQRFGNTYDFSSFQNDSIGPLLSRFVPPGAVQALIENIVKHNQGDHERPLQIEVEFGDNYCAIKNEIRAKLTSVESTQTGLKSLEMRYRLLSDQKLMIKQTEGSFEVKIPLLKSV